MWNDAVIFGKKAWISRSAVNSWEMGLSLPSLANIVEMTKIFNVKADYILGLENQVTVDITELTNEEREVVFKLVECLKKIGIISVNDII